MTNEEIIKAEEIRGEIRKVFNQIIDEEFEAVIKNIKNGDGKLTTKSIPEIIDLLMNLNFGECRKY